MLHTPTDSIRISPLSLRGGLLDMIHIRTLQKCCGKWEDTGRSIVCKTCGKSPTKYYLHWYRHETFKLMEGLKRVIENK